MKRRSPELKLPPPPAGLKSARLMVGVREFLVLSMPSDDLLAALTPAERQIAERLVLGRSNAELARERGTSERTVANQVRAILEKTGTRSRAELTARLTSPLLGGARRAP
jgi:DNA-binding CsgD family transcriptional regulator